MFDLAQSSVSWWVNLLQVEPSTLFLGTSSPLREDTVVICDFLLVAADYQCSLISEDMSSCFLRSFCIRYCCLAVPIFLAVSGSRQDCYNFSMRESILWILESIIGFSCLSLIMMVLGDYTPMALLRQSLLFFSYFIRIIAWSQVELNSRRITNINLIIYPSKSLKNKSSVKLLLLIISSSLSDSISVRSDDNQSWVQAQMQMNLYPNVTFLL